MNYEQKYKEALKKARQFSEHPLQEDSSSIVEYIFPELKESEDERIRKAVIEMIHDTPNIECEENYNVRKEDVLAWLEKQCEQKPTLPKWKYKKDHTPLLRDSIILNKYGGVAKSPSGAIVSDVWVIDYDELSKLPKEELEKQGEKDKVTIKKGEQEPIEWKDSDEKYLFWALLSIQKDIAASEINGVNTKGLNDCVKWLYSLKQRIGG